ncbi:hypothetical protein V6N12_014687 [Hibiscus sabdariffa]|uniref:Uncharacterized protein n=1 Tax=Hibiscus sabdariffa TaxID=183260 RepID=A0ABR2DKX7_9ROSI
MPPKKITEAGLSEVLQSGNPVRIANKSLINYIFTLSLEVASQFDFPLQIHIGFTLTLGWQFPSSVFMG